MACNLSLSGVSSLSGLHRLELGELILSPSRAESSSNATHLDKGVATVVGGAMLMLTAKGSVLPAAGMVGGGIGVEPGTGTFLAPRIGPHEMTGDVNFLGNRLRNGVLESPHIRYDNSKSKNSSSNTIPSFARDRGCRRAVTICTRQLL